MYYESSLILWAFPVYKKYCRIEMYYRMMFNIFRASYAEKRAMVLWSRAYKKKLLARKQALKYKYEINTDRALLKNDYE